MSGQCTLHLAENIAGAEFRSGPRLSLVAAQSKAARRTPRLVGVPPPQANKWLLVTLPSLGLLAQLCRRFRSEGLDEWRRAEQMVGEHPAPDTAALMRQRQ